MDSHADVMAYNSATQRQPAHYDPETGGGATQQSMYRTRGPRIRSGAGDGRPNLIKYCYPVLFIVFLIAVPFYLYIVWDLSRVSGPPAAKIATDNFPLLPDGIQNVQPADRDSAPRATSGLYRLNQGSMVWYSVDITVPESSETSALIRFPKAGGYDGIRTTNIVRSYMQCLKHSNELIEVGGGTPEDEHFHYVIREHRQSGRAFVELHRGDEHLTDLVWCRFYVLTTSIGVT